MIVGHDVTGSINNDARAQGLLHPVALESPEVAEELLQRGGADLLAHHAACVDIDHRRGRAMDRRCEGMQRLWIRGRRCLDFSGR